MKSMATPLTEGRVDERPPPCLRFVGGHKILDPVHHGSGRESVARGTVGVVLNVESTGQRDAVA